MEANEGAEMTATDFWTAVHSLGFAPATNITVTEDPEPAAYRVKGTTQDVTDCAHGHTNLKKTVILATLDADGTETGIIHLGVDCAARVMRTTETRIRNTAATADAERAEKVAWATDLIAVYGPVEGDIRATATVFFGRNPHMRDRVRASVWVGTQLAKARTILAA